MVVDCICIAGSRLTREHEHEHRYKRAEASKGTGRAFLVTPVFPSSPAPVPDLQRSLLPSPILLRFGKHDHIVTGLAYHSLLRNGRVAMRHA
jgi:hypothetical protein